MAKKEKFKFRREKAITGLAAVVDTASTRIKIGKQVCGYIHAPKWSDERNEWRIHLMVKSPESSTGFKWVFLKKGQPTETAAREFLLRQEIYDAIREKYDLYFEDDDYSDRN